MNFVQLLDEFKKQHESSWSNETLSAAKVKRNDEFYTTTEIIKTEMQHWISFLENKTVYLPADSLFLCSEYFNNKQEWPSAFWIYFKKNFKVLKLKKLIATAYNPNSKGELAVYTGDGNDDDVFDGVEISKLQGDGDMLGEEVNQYYQESNIVITNPPFSIARKFYNKLKEQSIDFIILGGVMFASYVNTFKDYKTNNLHAYGLHKDQKAAYIDARNITRDADGKIVISKGGPSCFWYSNLWNKQHKKADFDRYFKNETMYSVYLDEKDNLLPSNFLALDTYKETYYQINHDSDVDWYILPITAMYAVDFWERFEVCCILGSECDANLHTFKKLWNPQTKKELFKRIIAKRKE
ncbi:adenine-specific methyltransferase EcoRI-like protein [Mycoplasmopsis mustelae]|uniref:Adenine-specific methyltransferase EcoRI-like protein n=1 Tax=Mycoplasmopsis mustelae TaxID=171289 RepID=A0A4R7UEF7_9BACT|nr:adenine-specific methyltransferase EcoRI family protein [Mycoplasmopsis mustelae]TDV23523.1 adenine-specific methyltransferase EcoRI-like protein [Mycoplasmopsis mustelae]